MDVYLATVENQLRSRIIQVAVHGPQVNLLGFRLG